MRATDRQKNHIPLEDVLSAVLPQLASILASSLAIQVAIISRDGSLCFVNQGMADYLNLASTELVGQDFSGFLTNNDRGMFIKCLSGADTFPEEGLLLNLVAADQIPRTIRCRIISVDKLYLLVAESTQMENRSLQDELLQLNNQLAVLSRENVRKRRELAGTLAALKKTQSMLVHQVKMASLGQMTAGIAHEINNPLAYVMNNEHVLRRDFDDLSAFINVVGDVLPAIVSLAPHIHAQIIAKAQEVGLENLSESVPRKISANLEGLERVKEIILDLRNFSRLDEAERKLCCLAEGIESTVRFLGPLIKEHGVTIKTDFAQLPELLCSPGPLNQAISNVLTNAIHASHFGQTVSVVTREEGGWYCIEVTDRGVGIRPEHLSKVFDPFFTTKPVGSGTGLGMSIAHQVVEAQRGKIEIESSFGVGTTVRILLPPEKQ